jgi:hypothetical protein
MEVKIVRGYGIEKESEDAQNDFLSWLKSIFTLAGMTVDSISSENKLGGPITIKMPDDTQPKKIINIFQFIVESASEGEEETGFELELPPFTEPITVVG